MGPLGLAQQPDLLRYADPMIGTQRMGHVYPGATAPFGMVQVGPDTDTLPYAVNGTYDPAVYRTCSGYQYDDSTIVGFSHTHFSGTGHSDLGDVLLMPATGPLQLDPGTADAPERGFRSVYHHRHEHAAPATTACSWRTITSAPSSTPPRAWACTATPSPAWTART